MDTPKLSDLTKAYIHHYCVDTICQVRSPIGMMSREPKEYILSVRLDDDDDDDAYVSNEY